MALDLADDRRRRVGRQLEAAVGVEAVDRLDQADRADLDEILELLAAPVVAAGQRADERQVLLDQLVARGLVAFLVVAPKQLAVVAPPLLRHASSPVTPLRRRTQAAPSRPSISYPDVVASSSRARPTAPGVAVREPGLDAVAVERAEHDRDAAVVHVDLHVEALRVGAEVVREERVERELDVLERLDGEPRLRREPAQDKPNHALVGAAGGDGEPDRVGHPGPSQCSNRFGRFLLGRGDQPGADDRVALVEDGGLARRDAVRRRVELEVEPVAARA